MAIETDSISRFAVKQFEELRKYGTVAMLDLHNNGSVRYMNGIPIVSGTDKIDRSINHYKVDHVSESCWSCKKKQG